MDELNQLIDQAKKDFASCSKLAELDHIKSKFLGKSGPITEAMKSLASLSPEEKPKNLTKLLQNKNITKIFHYGRFDLAILNKNIGPVVGPIYCTKIASKLSRTFGAKHGLKDLCKDLLNIELDKFNQTSDWGTEILSKDQLAYAAQDVLFLHKLKIKLDEILLREGKMNLALECFESLKTRVKLDLEGFQELDIFAH